MAVTWLIIGSMLCLRTWDAILRYRVVHHQVVTVMPHRVLESEAGGVTIQGRQTSARPSRWGPSKARAVRYRKQDAPEGGRIRLQMKRTDFA
jgi:cytochrome b